MTKDELLAEYPCGYEVSHAAKIAGIHLNTLIYAIEHKHVYPFRSLSGTPKISPAELARYMTWREEQAEKKAAARAEKLLVK